MNLSGKDIILLAQIVSLMIVAFLLIGFVEKKQSNKLVNDLIINIQKDGELQFIDDKEVQSLMNAGNTDYVFGTTIKNINLDVLEERIEKHHFVSDAQVSHDIKGNLLVNILQSKPIARIYNGDGTDCYISKSGRVIPISGNYTARVPVLFIENKKLLTIKNIKDDAFGQKLFNLLDYIHEDRFWSAQIAELYLDKYNEIVIYPQISKQKVAFGTLEDIEKKFKKLKIFYEKILPYKGWNTYERVSLKFKNQIVCE